MAPNQFPLTLVVNVQVNTPPTGVSQYNTSNLAIFTTEIPGNTFTGLFQNYLQPGGVATDFGSGSQTYKMANAVFSQVPNILAGNGQLVVIPLLLQIQTLVLSGVPASGTFELQTSNGTTAAINWNDTVAQIQAKLEAVTGQTGWKVTGSLASESLVVTCGGTYGVAPPITVTANSLQTGGAVGITFVITQTQVGETLGAAVTRTKTLVQYFGITSNLTCATIGQTDLLACAAVIQALNKIGFFVSYTEADILPGGMIDLLRTNSYTQSRGLYYDDSTSGGLNAILFAASYAGRGLSVDFTGFNTAIDMDLKTLVGVSPDPNITQTILNEAQAAGADCYISYGQNDGSGNSVGKVSSSGANSFYDQVYNSQWLQGALQVAAFNFLSQVSTKVPQTEQGMDAYKAVLRTVMVQARNNGYAAPGAWTSSTTFGNQADLIANVAQVGFYIWSQPVAQQTQANRVARKAPPVQIALKEAGSIESANIIVNVNP